jgi:predicted RNase H-like nuclease (RuvC/YqgF family)
VAEGGFFVLKMAETPKKISPTSFISTEADREGVESTYARYIEKHSQFEKYKASVDERFTELNEKISELRDEIEELKEENRDLKQGVGFLAKPCLWTHLEVKFKQEMNYPKDKDSGKDFSLVAELKQDPENKQLTFSDADLQTKTGLNFKQWLVFFLILGHDCEIVL